MSMMAGLQCLSPTLTQCHEMMVECMCPVNGEAIDSWETPCTRQPDAVYMYDHITQRCLTCDQYLALLPLQPGDPAEPTAEEQTGPYAAGDFPCRLGGPYGDQMEIDCVSVAGADALGVNIGAVSGASCPYPQSLVEEPAEPQPEPEVLPNCGEHGHFSGGSCQCDTEAHPDTGETLKCWQTNRERSNRHPNGNIIEWCTIAMCNFDSSGNAVLASGAQAGSTPDENMSIIADLAKAFGVSPGVVVGAGALVLATSCWLMCSGSTPKEQRRGGEAREFEMDAVLPVVVGRPAETHNPLVQGSGRSRGGGRSPDSSHGRGGRGRGRGRARPGGVLGVLASQRAQETAARPQQQQQQQQQYEHRREHSPQRGMLGHLQMQRAQEYDVHV